MSVTMFSTRWCGHCIRLKRALEEAGIPFTEIDIDDEPQHGARIERVTGGNRTVPTIEVSGRMFVNPTVRQLLEVLGT